MEENGQVQNEELKQAEEQYHAKVNNPKEPVEAEIKIDPKANAKKVDPNKATPNPKLKFEMDSKLKGKVDIPNDKSDEETDNVNNNNDIDNEPEDLYDDDVDETQEEDNYQKEDQKGKDNKEDKEKEGTTESEKGGEQAGKEAEEAAKNAEQNQEGAEQETPEGEEGEESADSGEDSEGAQSNGEQSEQNADNKEENPEDTDKKDEENNQSDQDKPEEEQNNNENKEEAGEDKNKDDQEKPQGGQNPEAQNKEGNPAQDAADKSEEGYKANQNNSNNPDLNNEEQDPNKKDTKNPQEQGKNNPADKKEDGSKERVDKAKKKGENNPNDKDKKPGASGEDGDKKNNIPGKDKVDQLKNAKSKITNPKEAAKQKLKEEKEKRIKQGKRDVALGNYKTKDAIFFAASKPLEYAAMIGLRAIKNLIKKLFMANPFIFTIVVIVLILIIFILLLISGFTDDGTSMPPYNKYDFTQVLVQPYKGPEIGLDEAVLGVAYEAMFVNKNIASEGYSDRELESIFTAYVLYAKTRILTSPKKNKYHYDATTGNYRVYMYSGTGRWFTFCDSSTGCYKSWGNYHPCEVNDDSDEDDCQFPGLLSYEEGTKEANAADILIDVVERFDSYLAAPYSLNSVLTKVDSSFGVEELDKSLFKKIKKLVKNNSCLGNMSNNDEILIDNVNNLLSAVQSGLGDGCKAKSNSVKAYNIKDYLIDERTAYRDIGFWWPIGSNEGGKAVIGSMASGEPASTTINSYFGYRPDDNGKINNHKGIDINGSNNITPIIAVAKGTVVDFYCTPYSGPCGFNQTSTKFSGGGCEIHLEHSNGLITKYLHVSEESFNEFSKKYNKGDEIEQGTVIARVGSTGCSTGAHLHFGIVEDNKFVNPLNYVSNTNTRSDRYSAPELTNPEEDNNLPDDLDDEDDPYSDEKLQYLSKEELEKWEQEKNDEPEEEEDE